MTPVHLPPALGRLMPGRRAPRTIRHVTRVPASCTAVLVALLAAAFPGPPPAEGHPAARRPAAAPCAPIWRAPVAAPVVEPRDSVSPGAQRHPTQTQAMAGPRPL